MTRRTFFTHRALVALITALVCVPTAAIAASSWNPTLLVNTESFQTIDEGDSTTDIEIRFGGTLNEKLLWDRAGERFIFTDDLSVRGTMSGSALQVDGNAAVTGNLSVTGTSSFNGAATFTNGVETQATLSGATLFINGNGALRGTLSASGTVRTEGDLTINDDADTNDATLTFGNQSGNQTLQFVNSSQVFQFSKDVRVNGNLSGSSLTVDGSLTLRGVTYTAPSAQGSANTYLKNDGAGNLSWSSVTTGNSSGGIISLHPEFANAVYMSSGSTVVGQLTLGYDGTNQQNYYRWTSTKSSLQDYWIAVRVRIPDNFSSWDPSAPIQLRYRSGVASAASNYINLRLLDTDNNLVSLTGNAALNNTSWTTASITGPESGGTFTPKGYITLLVKMAALTTGSAFSDLGFINLNFETTTP